MTGTEIMERRKQLGVKKRSVFARLCSLSYQGLLLIEQNRVHPTRITRDRINMEFAKLEAKQQQEQPVQSIA